MPDLLIEIRTEELPAQRVYDAAVLLRNWLAKHLEDAGLLDEWKPENQPVLGTPRRLAAFLPGVKECQPAREERVWGPPVAAAFGPDGKPTKAGEGFAKSSGVPLEKMGRGEKVPGKPPYLFADRKVTGRTAPEVIAEALPRVAGTLQFKRVMRWPQSTTPFARPIRGLVVLLGREVVPCEFAGCKAGRITSGHRFLGHGDLSIPAADLDAYRDLLRNSKVLVDFGERLQKVAEQVHAARQSVQADTGTKAANLQQLRNQAADRELLEHVTGLVEWPSSLVGKFSDEYRDLPASILVTSMAHHLRYFPAFTTGGQVMSTFVSITDRESASSDLIRSGNERVLRARLYDADFFYRNDRKKRLADFRPGLAGMDFHKGLGTLLDKSERVRRIAAAFAGSVGLDAKGREAADRAAFLLKCDLLTEVVKEFPELQGVIGGGYARDDGEGEEVAAAISAQYLPAGLELPRAVRESDVPAVIVLAERMDSLCGYFSIGEEPTGSADPFGLRRAALALLQVLQKKPWTTSLDHVLALAAKEWNLDEARKSRLRTFVWSRADQMARSEGYTDFVETLGILSDRPFPEYWARLMALKALATGSPRWPAIVALVERTGNMGEKGNLDPQSLPKEARSVADALTRTTQMAAGLSAGRKEQADLYAFAEVFADELGAPVNTMFEKVLVDDPKEPARRAAIKALLYEVFALFRDRLGDLRRLGGGARPPRA